MDVDPDAEAPSFGELLHRYRVASRLTQEALADRAGLSARGISDLERGVRAGPRRDTLRLLIEALQLSPPERAALMATAGRAAERPGSQPGGASIPGRATASGNDAVGRPRARAGRGARRAARDDVRLLTLTGPGGVGKTRLALSAAATWATVSPTASCSSRSPRSPTRDSCPRRLSRRSACAGRATHRCSSG